MVRTELYRIVAVRTGLPLFWLGNRWCDGDLWDRPGAWPRAVADAIVAGRSGVADPGRSWRRGRAQLRLVPQCGCCGRCDPRAWVPPLVDVGGGWRCDRHLGRVPCTIDGCRRTFALRGSEDHDRIAICSAHWREAPRYMRDAVARVRRKAGRRGWDDALHARHDRLWRRALRAIREGERFDPAELAELFGWDMAA